MDFCDACPRATCGCAALVLFFFGMVLINSSTSSLLKASEQGVCEMLPPLKDCAGTECYACSGSCEWKDSDSGYKCSYDVVWAKVLFNDMSDSEGAREQDNGGCSALTGKTFAEYGSDEEATKNLVQARCSERLQDLVERRWVDCWRHDTGYDEGKCFTEAREIEDNNDAVQFLIVGSIMCLIVMACVSCACLRVLGYRNTLSELRSASGVRRVMYRTCDFTLTASARVCMIIFSVSVVSVGSLFAIMGLVNFIFNDDHVHNYVVGSSWLCFGVIVVACGVGVSVRFCCDCCGFFEDPQGGADKAKCFSRPAPQNFEARVMLPAPAQKAAIVAISTVQPAANAGALDQYCCDVAQEGKPNRSSWSERCGREAGESAVVAEV